MTLNDNIIAEITKRVVALKGARIASLTYLSKKAGELARYTANFGFSYNQVVEKSKLELGLLLSEDDAKAATDATKWNPDYRQAAAELMASFDKTLAAHARGEQNEDYTKKGQYIPLGNGASLNGNDNTLQLFGLVLTKAVLVEGVYPHVNSAPKTIAKNKIKKMLPIGNFREFALDNSQVAQMKVNGDTIEIPEMSAVPVS
jgi:hypothetical protein